MGGIYIKSFLPFDRKLILVSDQLFLYKSRPNFPSIFTAMHLLINSIDTARDTSVKMFHSVIVVRLLACPAWQANVVYKRGELRVFASLSLARDISTKSKIINNTT